ncbi:MAG: bacillithiol biosynthesis cysteine-adding enzyme BshC [Flavobacteriales bacterium]|nr:MAG: bacillithiol biosynthesis cysteine-adding enzyme BshC [Flavobacteriales bacterium]
MKKNKEIAFIDIPTIPQQIKDLLMGKLEDFQEDTFSWDNFERKIQAKSPFFTDEKRKVLHRVLSEQLSDFQLSEKQGFNLESLKDKKTFTITTGHQLNLFSGSVFFIYKILQTIKTAEVLNQKFPDYHFVPIFWLATEDHDFEEINHFKTATKKYQIHAESGNAVGRIKINDITFIKEFERDVKCLPFGAELVKLMKKAYQKGKTLTQATQEVVQYLFADRGLLFIDGDEKAFKDQMIPLFEKELQDFDLMKKSQRNRDFLTQKYGKVQVNPREINLFYLSDTRNRIVKNGEKWSVLDKDIHFTKSDLAMELKNHPERFSPNALLRPVFQEMVLPNLAYIGGNAEIMYWLELKDYCKAHQIPFPILIPRNSILFLDEKTVKKVERLNFKIDDFLGDIQSIINQKILDNHEVLALMNQQKESLVQQFKAIKDEAVKTHISFRNLVEAEETRQLKSFERMKKRLLKAERKRHQEYVGRVEDLYQKIHPSGVWQERIFNFSEFYLFKGEKWLDFCYDVMQIKKTVLIIAEN